MSILVSFGGNQYTIPEPGDAFTQSVTDLLNALATKATALVSAPATAASTGTTGQWSYDATHIYVCVATNTWVRATLATW